MAVDAIGAQPATPGKGEAEDAAYAMRQISTMGRDGRGEMPAG